jgi:hypothetical protein
MIAIEDVMKEAVSAGNGAGMAIALNYLPSQELKAKFIARYTDEIRAAVSSGYSYPLRVALENIDGRICKMRIFNSLEKQRLELIMMGLRAFELLFST